MKSGKFGVAATIMSKMGYREGSGLGAKEQGISRALQNWKKCWFNCWRRKGLCCVYKFV
uniref:G-patch domain-containing protein n=1 Tax=Meloidogyne incognita TaxID=6306 RepID=A0A914MCD6_MELIC